MAQTRNQNLNTNVVKQEEGFLTLTLNPGQQCPALDRALYNTQVAIESSRKTINDYHHSFNTLVRWYSYLSNLYQTEKQEHLKTVETKETLQLQHARLRSQSEHVSNENTGLRKEMDELRGLLESYHTELEQCRGPLAATHGSVEWHPTEARGRMPTESEGVVEQLETTIANLKRENLKMEEEHRATQILATQRIKALETKYYELACVASGSSPANSSRSTSKRSFCDISENDYLPSRLAQRHRTGQWIKREQSYHGPMIQCTSA